MLCFSMLEFFLPKLRVSHNRVSLARLVQAPAFSARTSSFEFELIHTLAPICLHSLVVLSELSCIF